MTLNSQNSTLQKDNRQGSRFSFPGFVAHPKFPFLILLILILEVILVLLAYLEAQALDHILFNPFPYLMIGGFIFYLIVHSFILREIKNTLGIDLNQGIVTPTKPKLQALFEDETAFSSFQERAIRKLRSKFFWFLFIIMFAYNAANPFIMMFIDPQKTKLAPDVDYESFSSPLTALYAILHPLFLAYIFTCIILTAFIVVFFVFIISKIGQNREELMIKRLSYSDLELAQIELKRKDELVKYSLERFKRYALEIPSITLKFSLIAVFGVILFNTIMVLLIITLQFIPETEILSLGYFIATTFVDVCSIIVIAFIFIYPQIALRNLIVEEKKNRIDVLETLYESKKILYLHSATMDSETLTNLEQLKFFEKIIKETNELLSWPFNYPQVITLVTSSLIPIISLAITMYGLFFGS